MVEQRQTGTQGDTRVNEKLPLVPKAGDLKDAAFCLKESRVSLGG